MSRRHTGILGAGALGLTLAYRLSRNGEAVTIFEREPEPGGLAAGFQVATTAEGKPVYLEKFYHHLFQADRAAVALIEELGLGSRLVWPTPRSTILRDGEILPVDSPMALLRLKALPFVDRLRLGIVGAYLKLEKGYQRLEGQTADAWLRRWMGKNAYELFAQPVLQQKFGAYSEQIAMPWFWSRVHLRSPSLGYMQGGFQHLYATLAERIQQQGGTLHLQTTVTGIAPQEDGKIEVTAGGIGHRFDRVISTLPARITYDLAPAIPEEFRSRYRPGAAFGAHCLVLELDRQLTDVYWIAVNDPGYPFLVVVEHTNYMPPEQYGGKHLLYIGNYLPMDHPLFTQSKEEILAGFLPYLRRLNPALEASWIQQVHSFVAPYAQPIVTLDFHEHIPPHVTPVPNLYMANMFQIYPQDRGQNYSITMAERLAQRLIAENAK